jgi:serine/threonine protein kinase
MSNKEKDKQKGGKLLGEGGFGCVISPPLKCKNKHFTSVPYSIDSKYISKLVEYNDDEDEEIMAELKFGEKLIKLDPTQKYFSPIINGCDFYKQKSNDIEYHYYKPSTTETSDNTSTNNAKCKIYDDQNYLNLISKNAGINIKDALNTRDPVILSYFRNNYVHIFKHLCEAIKIIHKNNILHKDIKSLNIMFNYNTRTDKANITIIDFGLSDYLNKDTYSLRDLYYFVGAGTESYKPIEIIIIYNILSLLKKNKYKDVINFKKNVLDKILKTYTNISERYSEKYFFMENGFIYKNNQLYTNIGKEKHLYAFDEGRIEMIFEKIYQEIVDNIFIKNLMYHQKYITKWDIFSMGLVFAEIIVKCNINDNKAFELVNNMVNPNYWERYDINQCLNDKLFSGETKKQTKKPKTQHKQTKKQTKETKIKETKIKQLKARKEIIS